MRQNLYYPYGLKHSNYNAIEYAYKENELGTYVVLDPTQRSDYRYKYNGMEFQDELGLNLYDMDFRDYDPAIARWTGIDPVTHHNMSPYMAFDGNPVFWADPSGADVIIYGNAVEFNGEDAGGFFNALLAGLNGGTVVSYNFRGQVYDLQETVMLPTLSISRANYYSVGNGGGLMNSIQHHTYKKSPFYQYVRDQWSAERWNDFAQTLQDWGDATAVAGYALTLTGVGAEIGIPLAAIGNAVSTAGAVTQILSNAYYTDNYAKSVQGTMFTFAGELLPKVVNRIPGLELITEQLLKQNISLKIMGISRLVESNQTQ